MAKRSKIDGGFIVIPKRTLRSKQWKDLKQCGKIVYVAMLTEFIRDKKLNPENKVKITQKQIENITGQCHQTVVNGVKELKEDGFLHIEQDEQGGLERNYTTYTLSGCYLW